MGLFTPKYPTGSAPAHKPRRESRSARKDRERHERLDRQLAEDFKTHERESKERTARFWKHYEDANGPGSVDWT